MSKTKLAGSLDINNQPIINVPDPVNPLDAVNLQTLQNGLASIIISSSDSNVEIIYNTPQNIWIFPHNLGFYPSINVYDNTGSELIGYNRIDNNINTLTLSFGIQMTGKIIAS